MRWACLVTGAFALLVGVSACSSLSKCEGGCDESLGGRRWVDGTGAGAGAVGGAGGAASSRVIRPLAARSDHEPCTFDIGALPSNDGRFSYDAIEIFADGESVARDPEHSYGWDFADPSRMSIALYGAVCRSVETGEVQLVSIAFRYLDG